MKTAPESPFELQVPPEAQDQCSVTVVYEDTAARQRALSLSHHLIRAFWADIDFQFSWWRFRFLEDPALVEAAARATATADVILFSTSSSHIPPETIRNWIELWVPQRTSGEGVLLVLTAHSDDAQMAASPVYSFLQSVAHRANMDCLPSLTADPWVMETPAIQRIQYRAQERSRILDNILRQGPHSTPFPSHWGINE
jgi:hypothetical protein